MINILFVCLGNICRSPMAEFVFKNMADEKGLTQSFCVRSAATSDWEVGNDTHRGTKEKLLQKGVPMEKRAAVMLDKSDYDKYDFIIGMEKQNLVDIIKIVGEDINKKVYSLLDFTQNPRDIKDPWYTGDFDATYDDITKGCSALLSYIKANCLDVQNF
ncbi:MAG: low molecular weight protein-tyrosine-phosphatase [Oscillospiraceae bacterium]